MKSILSLLCLMMFLTMTEMNTTQMDQDIKLLIQEPSEETNVLKRDLEKDRNFFGLLETEQEKPILLTLWVFSLYLIVASIIKLAYHQSNFLTTTIPESCVLIMIGIAFGTLTKINDFNKIPKFSVDLFFFGLMPPIILQSAFALHNEYFFDNIITIIMYAVMGTLINEFLIGVSLYVCSLYGFFPKISLIELLIFSNAISAVDPVTVLTIFQDLKVNKPLYYLVFGESLLNDAVVIVVHSLLESFLSAPIISSRALVYGFNSFFYTSIGGFMIGVIFGLMTAFITLYTRHSLVIEPMIMIGMAYCSFLTADLISWSGLISLIGCGLVQFEFAWDNISKKTRITVKYIIITLSSVADLLIFFFLGQMLINEEQDWNTIFVVLTIVFCLLYRSFSVSGLTYISNNYFHRTRPINSEEQILMAYGGLRGAVAFAMIALLEGNKDIENFKLLKTTTFVLIFFTVFVLGGTTKPLLNLLRIQKEANESKKLCFILNDKVIDIVINGIEDFIGNPSTMNFLKHKLQNCVKYLKKYLCNKEKDKMIEHEIPKFLSVTNVLENDNSIVKEKTDFIDPKFKPSVHIDDIPKKTEGIARNIISNKDLFLNIFSEKLNSNAFVLRELHRKHMSPKELSSRMIAANQEFRANKKIFKNSTKSSMNSSKLIQRFKTSVPQSNDIDGKKIEQKPTDDKTQLKSRKTKSETN